MRIRPRNHSLPNVEPTLALPGVFFFLPELHQPIDGLKYTLNLHFCKTSQQMKSESDLKSAVHFGSNLGSAATSNRRLGGAQGEAFFGVGPEGEAASFSGPHEVGKRSLTIVSLSLSSTSRCAQAQPFRTVD